MCGQVRRHGCATAREDSSATSIDDNAGPFHWTLSSFWQSLRWRSCRKSAFSSPTREVLIMIRTKHVIGAVIAIGTFGGSSAMADGASDAAEAANREAWRDAIAHAPAQQDGC